MLKMSGSEKGKKYEGLIATSAFLFYLLVAYKSSGYHHEDEHYQLIEFANYKLGLLPQERLAWEFNSQIRPGFQPFLCYILLSLLRFIGITDGFTLAFFLRAITGIFSLLVVKRFVAAFKSDLHPSLFIWFTISSYLLWFLPYIYVRFSSETWSGLLLLLAIAQIRTKQDVPRGLNSYAIGLLLGIAILFRYQTALAVAGLLLWLVLVRKQAIAELTRIILCIILVLLVGILFDYWLYGSFTITLFNYFWVNIVQGVSSNFGVSPWYEYLVSILTDPGPFGIIILTSFLYLIFTQPRNIILWTAVPFLVVHSIIPHKELRFLFPVAGLIPLLCFTAFQDVVARFKKLGALRRLNPLTISIATILCVANAAGLLAVAATGAGAKRIPVAEYIHRNYPLKNTRMIISGDINPYMDWGPPKNSYYSSSGLDVLWVDNIWKDDLISRLAADKSNVLIIAEADTEGPRATQLLRRKGFKKVYQNIPDLVKIIYRIYDPDMLSRSLEVYEHDSANPFYNK